MAKLYVANCTKQFHNFTYVVPGATRYKLNHLPIDPGFQTQVYQEAPMPVLEAIVEQHRKYGLVNVTELANVKEFVGLCFSFDKPVRRDDILFALDHNNGVLFDAGLKYRRDRAIAVDAAYENVMEDARHQHDGRDIPSARNVDVEYLEDAATPQFGEALRVDHRTDTREPTPIEPPRGR